MFVALKENEKTISIRLFSTYTEAYIFAKENKWDKITDGFGKVIKEVK